MLNKFWQIFKNVNYHLPLKFTKLLQKMPSPSVIKMGLTILSKCHNLEVIKSTTPTPVKFISLYEGETIMGSSGQNYKYLFFSYKTIAIFFPYNKKIGNQS